MFTRIWTGKTSEWPRRDQGSFGERYAQGSALLRRIDQDWSSSYGADFQVLLADDVRLCGRNGRTSIEVLAREVDTTGQLKMHGRWSRIDARELANLLSSADLSRLDRHLTSAKDDFAAAEAGCRPGGIMPMEGSTAKAPARIHHASDVQASFAANLARRVESSLEGLGSLVSALTALGIDGPLPIDGLLEARLWVKKGEVVIGDDALYFPSKVYEPAEFVERYGARGVAMLEQTIEAARGAVPSLQRLDELLQQHQGLVAVLGKPLVPSVLMVDENTTVGENGLRKGVLTLDHCPWELRPLTASQVDSLVGQARTALEAASAQLKAVAPELAKVQKTLTGSPDVINALRKVQESFPSAAVVITESGGEVKVSGDALHTSLRLQLPASSVEAAQAQLAQLSGEIDQALKAFSSGRVSAGSASAAADEVRDLLSTPQMQAFLRRWGALQVPMDPNAGQDGPIIYLVPEGIDSAVQALGKDAVSRVVEAIKAQEPLNARLDKRAALKAPVEWNQAAVWAAFGALVDTFRELNRNEALANARIMVAFNGATRASLTGRSPLYTATLQSCDAHVLDERGIFERVGADRGGLGGGIGLWFEAGRGQMVTRMSPNLSLQAIARLVADNDPQVLGPALDGTNRKLLELLKIEQPPS